MAEKAEKKDAVEAEAEGPQGDCGAKKAACQGCCRQEGSGQEGRRSRRPPPPTRLAEKAAKALRRRLRQARPRRRRMPRQPAPAC